MNERRVPIVSLVAIVVLTFAVLFGLERLLAWGRADDAEEIIRIVDSLKKDNCSELPSGLSSTTAECYLQDSGIFQYRWCFPRVITEIRSEYDVSRINIEGRIGGRQTPSPRNGHSSMAAGRTVGVSAGPPVRRLTCGCRGCCIRCPVFNDVRQRIRKPAMEAPSTTSP